jgi:hypothetical protein
MYNDDVASSGRASSAIMRVRAWALAVACAVAHGQAPIEPPSDVRAPPPFAVATNSGLSYTILLPGFGERPEPRARVLCHYTGWTTDGEMFDSSVARGQPPIFGVNQVIQGFGEGLELTREGGKTRLWIPADLAYGRSPSGGRPAGMLVFDIQLLRASCPSAGPCTAALPPAEVDDPTGGADDSCTYANDGMCDEPQFCQDGTDSTDCATPDTPEDGAGTCLYTSDGECDEIEYCATGTDTADCCPPGGTPATRDAYCGKIPGYPAYVPICQYANDGECDETDFCERGTDSDDCCPILLGSPVPQRPEADCSAVSGFVPADPASSEESCQFVNDSECDESLDCPPGTDTADCCPPRRPPATPAAVCPDADACGCRPGYGWSQTTDEPCCKAGSTTSEFDAQSLACQSGFGNYVCAREASDRCGCPVAYGWSVTTGRGCCKRGSITQPEEVDTCQVELGNMDCAPVGGAAVGEQEEGDGCGCFR